MMLLIWVALHDDFYNLSHMMICPLSGQNCMITEKKGTKSSRHLPRRAVTSQVSTGWGWWSGSWVGLT